jgi:hypothetical protein
VLSHRLPLSVLRAGNPTSERNHSSVIDKTLFLRERLMRFAD